MCGHVLHVPGGVSAHARVGASCGMRRVPAGTPLDEGLDSGTNARTKGLNKMGIGTGIVLAVIGLILLTGTIQVDLPGIEDYTLGWILLVAGAIAVVLSMTVWRRGSTTRVVERDVQGPPV